MSYIFLYYCRKLDDKYLYYAVDIYPSAVHAYRKASVERAVADMLYFNSHAYFDADLDDEIKRLIEDASHVV